MRPSVGTVLLAIVVLAGTGCGSKATVSTPVTLPPAVTVPPAATTATTALTTTSSDTMAADTAAIEALWRAHSDAGRRGGWRAFYQVLADTAYPQGAWNLKSITCYDRLVRGNRQGRHLTVDDFLAALDLQGPPPVQTVDPATIQPSPGWALGSADAAVGGGRVPPGGLYVMTLTQKPSGPPTLPVHAHVTVIAGIAYWFPFSCVEPYRSP